MAETPFPTLNSERLILRQLTDADVVSYLTYLNDPLVAKYQTWESFPEERAWEVIEEQKALDIGSPGTTILFAVELRETCALAGHVVLTFLEKDTSQAEIGFTFAREYHGLGIAREASTLVLDYAFAALKLHRVIAITDCENLSSIALLGRLGMRREGHFIQNIFFKGKWGDEFLYAILAEEWSLVAGT